MILVRHIPKLCDACCSKWLKALGRIKETRNLTALSHGNIGSVEKICRVEGKGHHSHFPMYGVCVPTTISEIANCVLSKALFHPLFPDFLLCYRTKNI